MNEKKIEEWENLLSKSCFESGASEEDLVLRARRLNEIASDNPKKQISIVNCKRIYRNLKNNTPDIIGANHG